MRDVSVQAYLALLAASADLKLERLPEVLLFREALDGDDPLAWPDDTHIWGCAFKRRQLVALTVEAFALPDRTWLVVAHELAHLAGFDEDAATLYGTWVAEWYRRREPPDVRVLPEWNSAEVRRLRGSRGAIAVGLEVVPDLLDDTPQPVLRRAAYDWAEKRWRIEDEIGGSMFGPQFVFGEKQRAEFERARRGVEKNLQTHPDSPRALVGREKNFDDYGRSGGF